MKNNRDSKMSSLDLSKIYNSVKALDSSIEAFLNVLNNKYLNISTNEQCCSQQKQYKNNNSNQKKRIVKKLNTSLIKQLLIEAQKHKKETIKTQKRKNKL